MRASHQVGLNADGRREAISSRDDPSVLISDGTRKRQFSLPTGPNGTARPLDCESKRRHG
jgi:hypothetical protein